jgi:hypothetical protein
MPPSYLPSSLRFLQPLFAVLNLMKLQKPTGCVRDKFWDNIALTGVVKKAPPHWSYDETLRPRRASLSREKRQQEILKTALALLKARAL